jgi:hypothetical protein
LLGQITYQVWRPSGRTIDAPKPEDDASPKP